MTDPDKILWKGLILGNQSINYKEAQTNVSSFFLKSLDMRIPGTLGHTPHPTPHPTPSPSPSEEEILTQRWWRGGALVLEGSWESRPKVTNFSPREDLNPGVRPCRSSLCGWLLGTPEFPKNYMGGHFPREKDSLLPPDGQKVSEAMVYALIPSPRPEKMSKNPL